LGNSSITPLMAHRGKSITVHVSIRCTTLVPTPTSRPIEAGTSIALPKTLVDWDRS